jgi:histidinol phosphatase-like enzyme (inositol monophosphatase family)
MLAVPNSDLTAGLEESPLFAEVGFAVQAARRAGDLTLEAFEHRTFSMRSKADGSPVTEADVAAEALLRSEIGATFPADGILGEEAGNHEGTNNRRWILDPIDGTRAFTRGVPTFATLLALEVDSRAAVGVIYLPALGELLVAAAGGGAWLNGAPCRVSNLEDLSEYVASTSGYDYWAEPGLERLRSTGYAMRTWGDAWGHALVASGRVEMMIDPVAWPWDLAAISVITTEAGGTFLGLDGTSSFDTGGGASCTPALADVTADVLRAAAGNP